MTHLNPAKLSITRVLDSQGGDGFLPRWYTLTHSDRTGDLFLTVGRSVDEKQIAGWYTRFMRDEVLAEWRQDEQDNLELHVYVHVSGGLVFGSARFRDSILRRHMPMVLEAFRYTEKEVVQLEPKLDRAGVKVHFQSHREEFDRIEDYGSFGDWLN